MTTIETYQKSRRNWKNMTAAVDITIYETAIRCAELNGYTNVSAFVKDAILDKVKSTATSMLCIADERRSMAN